MVEPGISPTPTMLRVPVSSGRWLERAIPNRLNRSLWALLAGLGYAIVLSGPIVAVFIYDALYRVPILPTLLWIWAINIGTYTLVMLLGLLLLSRLQQALTGARAVLFAIGLAAIGVVIRAIVMSILAREILPQTGALFSVVQLALGLIFIAALVAAVSYAASRERVIEDAFRELTRVNTSLAREEESVRGEIFDQLHGSLQAEVVAIRRRLDDLARETTDPRAARTAEELEQSLDRLYRDGIGAVARALIPQGLEVGLRAALDELTGRLDQAAVLRVRFDPVAAALDDPMSGGLHRSLRITSYRIIEEAVSNAMRHAQATDIDVEVGSTLDDGVAMLTLRIAHPVDSTLIIREGSGLGRMKARAQALGGSVTFTSGSSRFTVTASLPLAMPDGGRWAEVEVSRG